MYISEKIKYMLTKWMQNNTMIANSLLMSSKGYELLKTELYINYKHSTYDDLVNYLGLKIYIMEGNNSLFKLAYIQEEE